MFLKITFMFLHTSKALIIRTVKTPEKSSFERQITGEKALLKKTKNNR